MIKIPGFPRRQLKDKSLVLAGNSLLKMMGDFANRKSYRLLGEPGQIKENFAVGASTTQDMVDTADAVDAVFAPKKTLIVWEARNHHLFGATVQESIDLMLSYCQARKRVGWTIVLLGTTPTQRSAYGSAAAFNAGLIEIHEHLRDNYRDFADAFVDTRRIPEIQDPADRSIYRDGTHFTNLGYLKLIPHINVAITKASEKRVLVEVR